MVSKIEKTIEKNLSVGKSNLSVEQLENLCIELETKVRKIKDILKAISKVINQEIKKI